ncbi:MAG: IPT/TIG domain-containing protein, partial [Kiritimatiellota bacterium]|nr:IPT/TIG domain-containing protein [Kiritimatiellota bacterium]
MNKQLAAIIIMIVFWGGAAQAVGSSASYKMTAEVINAGAALGSSTSFRLEGKARERVIDSPAGSSFILGAGFMKSAYFSAPTPILSPVVTSITPNSGLSTGPVNITNLAGANFQNGAGVKLSKSGQTDINATAVAVVSSGQITCTIDLTGAAAGLWDVTVTNPDGRSGSLPSAFTVAFAAPTVIAIAPASGL